MTSCEPLASRNILSRALCKESLQATLAAPFHVPQFAQHVCYHHRALQHAHGGRSNCFYLLHGSLQPSEHLGNCCLLLLVGQKLNATSVMAFMSPWCCISACSPELQARWQSGLHLLIAGVQHIFGHRHVHVPRKDKQRAVFFFSGHLVAGECHADDETRRVSPSLFRGWGGPSSPTSVTYLTGKRRYCAEMC